MARWVRSCYGSGDSEGQESKDTGELHDDVFGDLLWIFERFGCIVVLFWLLYFAMLMDLQKGWEDPFL